MTQCRDLILGTTRKVRTKRTFRKVRLDVFDEIGLYASVAIRARRVSIPSPFSELVTTISG